MVNSSEMMLVFLFLIVVTLAWASERNCETTRNPSSLPQSTDECLKNQSLDDICAGNSPPFCHLTRDIQRYCDECGPCIFGKCPDDTEIHHFSTFRDQCDSVHKSIMSVTGLFERQVSIVTITEPTSDPDTSASGGVSQFSTLNTPEPTTGPIVLPSFSTFDPPVFTSVDSTSTPRPPEVTSTRTTSASGPSTLISSQPGAAESPHSAPSAPDTFTITTFKTVNSPLPTPATSNHPSSHGDPFMNTTKIAWTIAGGTVLIIACLGAALFILRRRKRRQRGILHPPSYVAEQRLDEKPELDGRSLTSYSSQIPAGVMEMEAGLPVSFGR